MKNLGPMIAAAGFMITGIAVGTQMPNPPPPTEQSTARSLARDQEMRLIGFDCGDHHNIMIARHEDEFHENGCREIRILDNKEPWL